LFEHHAEGVAVRNIFTIALGVTTSTGGFLDAGVLRMAAQAAARFRYSLIWAMLLGTVCCVLLMEMAGRVAIVSGPTVRDAIHERFGAPLSIPYWRSGWCSIC
jgi:Mn2+/Fe2+ NRAMP family transporter